MAYLSRIWLNPLRQQTRRWITRPQMIHAAVLGGLSAQPVDERVLWRLDTDEPRRLGLLVLTQSTPSWEHIIEQAGWPAADEPQAITRDYDPLLGKIAAGRSFAFRLTANPVQSRRNPAKANHRGDAAPRNHTRSARLGHRTAAHQMRWLLERTSQWGFEIPQARTDDGPTQTDPSDAAHDVRISSRQRRSFTRTAGAPPVVIQTVTYEGRLTVTDAEVLRERLVTGFGPAKAYGCGLLTLAALPGGR